MTHSRGSQVPQGLARRNYDRLDELCRGIRNNQRNAREGKEKMMSNNDALRSREIETCCRSRGVARPGGRFSTASATRNRPLSRETGSRGHAGGRMPVCIMRARAHGNNPLRGDEGARRVSHKRDEFGVEPFRRIIHVERMHVRPKRTTPWKQKFDPDGPAIEDDADDHARCGKPDRV